MAYVEWLIYIYIYIYIYRNNTYLRYCITISFILARPTDPAVIRYFMRMGEIFSSDGEAVEGRGEKLANACRVLCVEEHNLKKWHLSKTASVCRLLRSVP